MMPLQQPAHTVDREQLEGALHDTLYHGARADELFTYAPSVITLLIPGFRDCPLEARAYWAEKIIRRGISDLGGHITEGLSVLLALANDESAGMNLMDRRERAAKTLGIKPVTLRKSREKELLRRLAFQIRYNLAYPDQ
ncbi:hypothetical protein [Actinoallomurus sp. NPDC050550]|uniref:hypothetical protein n=1 Tax=Actinoallomurus sp. NPDC050550 TaxID=3154937 RepID=UPI0033F60452